MYFSPSGARISTPQGRNGRGIPLSRKALEFLRYYWKLRCLDM
jgi:hypothetical protein